MEKQNFEKSYDKELSFILNEVMNLSAVPSILLIIHEEKEYEPKKIAELLSSKQEENIIKGGLHFLKILNLFEVKNHKAVIVDNDIKNLIERYKKNRFEERKLKYLLLKKLALHSFDFNKQIKTFEWKYHGAPLLIFRYLSQILNNYYLNDGEEYVNLVTTDDQGVNLINNYFQTQNYFPRSRDKKGIIKFNTKKLNNAVSILKWFNLVNEIKSPVLKSKVLFPFIPSYYLEELLSDYYFHVGENPISLYDLFTNWILKILPLCYRSENSEQLDFILSYSFLALINQYPNKFQLIEEGDKPIISFHSETRNLLERISQTQSVSSLLLKDLE